MSVVVCPWCQSEITQEEGAEPEKWCPICENELDGYRTLQIGLGDSEEEEEDEELRVSSAAAEEDLTWMQDTDLQEKNEALLAFEETVEALLDEQDAVPECPHCREYMLETGEVVATAEAFRPRVPDSVGEPLLTAPFGMTVYVCPSCFTVHQTLSEQGRNDLARRLSRAGTKGRRS